MTDDPNRPINTDDEGEVRVYDAPAKTTGGSGSRLVWTIVIIIIILLILWWIF